MNEREDLPGTSESGGGSVHFLKPNRDLQSNWEVDLAKYLEDYLLNICSGEISPSDGASHSINFIEAAMLLQGSVQVYSRKVEYLYSLVLHALEFLSQKRQYQQDKSSVQNDGSESSAPVDLENEPFLGLNDVPVEAKNCLNSGLDQGDSSNHFVKPPANLLVLEGDCLNTGGDAGELESYLLATCEFYGDFLLLDPCDAGAISSFLKTNAVGKEQVASQGGGSVRSNTHHRLIRSPNVRSRGTAKKPCLGKNEGVNLNQTSENNCAAPQVDHRYPEDDACHVEEPNVGFSYTGDDSDDNNGDPWTPLNPHEPGNLKIKPYKKGNFFARQVFRNSKRNTQNPQFPIAKLDGFISREFEESFEVHLRLQEMAHTSESPPLYEKLRRSLSCVDVENDDNGGDNDIPDFEQAEFDPSQDTDNVDTEVPLYTGKDNIDSNTSLEDLCRSHLDSILASIAETEKQSEMAARVSTWTQRIEHALEEQEMHPHFNIHLYGERILDILSSEVSSGGTIPFTKVVGGHPKHDVARTFSALLQLVNNGNVDLQRAPSSGELICHTAANPFHVRLLRHQKRREEAEVPSSVRKRAKTPLMKAFTKANSRVPDAALPRRSPHQNGRVPVMIRKGSIVRCTPDGKRRRKSRVMEPVDLQFAS